MKQNKYKLLSAIFILASIILVNPAAIAKNVQHNMRVDGITCPFCVATSVKELKKIDGVININADISKGLIKVCANENLKLTDAQLKTLFLNKGFSYKGKQTIDSCELSEES